MVDATEIEPVTTRGPEACAWCKDLELVAPGKWVPGQLQQSDSVLIKHRLNQAAPGPAGRSSLWNIKVFCQVVLRTISCLGLSMLGARRARRCRCGEPVAEGWTHADVLASEVYPHRFLNGGDGATRVDEGAHGHPLAASIEAEDISALWLARQESCAADVAADDPRKVVRALAVSLHRGRGWTGSRTWSDQAGSRVGIASTTGASSSATSGIFARS